MKIDGCIHSAGIATGELAKNNVPLEQVGATPFALAEIHSAAVASSAPSVQSNVAGLIDGLYSRVADFDAAHARVEQLANRPALDPTSPDFFQQSQEQMMDLLRVQAMMGHAALGVELASKTVEGAAAGFRTLAQTQT